MTISERLADYALSFREDNVSEETWRIANIVLRDTLGCMLAGSDDIALQKMKTIAEEFGGKPQASVPGFGGWKTDIFSAARMSAMEAHVRDYDDIVVSMKAHATISMLPVMLVLGEFTGAGGTEAALAYISGVETAGTLGAALFEGGMSIGWDATCAIGVFGAAVTAGRLLHLDRDQMVCALGLAANDAGGFRNVYGYMNKDISAGHTAEKGIFAALAAKRGYDSAPDVFENKTGYLSALSGGIDMEELERRIDGRISIFSDPGIIMKKYPSCRDTHCAVDAAMRIRDREDFDPSSLIDHVTCYAGTPALFNDRFPYPDTPMQAKFSMPYHVALALKNGVLAIDDFAGETFRDPEAAKLCRKVQIICDDEHYGDSCAARVEVAQTNGKVFAETVDVALGDPGLPLDEAVLKAKFAECVDRISDKGNADELYELLADFRSITNISNLLKLFHAKL